MRVGEPLKAPRTGALVYTTVGSPIGELLLLGDGQTLRGLYMQEGSRPKRIARSWEPASEPFGELALQLGEYFAGRRHEFDAPLTMDGTPFQRAVWSALRDIPYGQTISYGELARRVGQASGVPWGSPTAPTRSP